MSQKPLAIGTVKQILRLHARNWTVNEIVHRTQVRADRVKLVLFEHGLRPLADAVPKKPPNYNPHRTDDPTPEEIEAAKIEIQATWTAATKQQRCVQPVEPLEVQPIITSQRRKRKHGGNEG
jgi:hypothetical protein